MNKVTQIIKTKATYPSNTKNTTSDNLPLGLTLKGKAVNINSNGNLYAESRNPEERTAILVALIKGYHETNTIVYGLFNTPDVKEAIEAKLGKTTFRKTNTNLSDVAPILEEINEELHYRFKVFKEAGIFTTENNVSAKSNFPKITLVLGDIDYAKFDATTLNYITEIVTLGRGAGIFLTLAQDPSSHHLSTNFRNHTKVKISFRTDGLAYVQLDYSSKAIKTQIYEV